MRKRQARGTAPVQAQVQGALTVGLVSGRDRTDSVESGSMIRLRGTSSWTERGKERALAPLVAGGRGTLFFIRIA